MRSIKSILAFDRELCQAFVIAINLANRYRLLMGGPLGLAALARVSI